MFKDNFVLNIMIFIYFIKLYSCTKDNFILNIIGMIFIQLIYSCTKYHFVVSIIDVTFIISYIHVQNIIYVWYIVSIHAFTVDDVHAIKNATQSM